MDKHGRYQPKLSIVLCGGFHCQLTDDEANSWREFVSNTPSWQDLKRNEHRLVALIARQHGTSEDLGSEIRGIRESQEAIKDRIYEISKEWYANLVEPQPKDAP